MGDLKRFPSVSWFAHPWTRHLHIMVSTKIKKFSKIFIIQHYSNETYIMTWCEVWNVGLFRCTLYIYWQCINCMIYSGITQVIPSWIVPDLNILQPTYFIILALQPHDWISVPGTASNVPTPVPVLLFKIFSRQLFWNCYFIGTGTHWTVPEK